MNYHWQNALKEDGRYFSPAIDRAFRRWLLGPALGPHTSDMERFYLFLRAVVSYSRRRRIDTGFEDGLQRGLYDRFPETSAEWRDEQFKTYSRIAYHVFDYERAGRPF